MWGDCTRVRGDWLSCLFSITVSIVPVLDTVPYSSSSRSTGLYYSGFPGIFYFLKCVDHKRVLKLREPFTQLIVILHLLFLLLWSDVWREHQCVSHRLRNKAHHLYQSVVWPRTNAYCARVRCFCTCQTTTHMNLALEFTSLGACFYQSSPKKARENKFISRRERIVSFRFDGLCWCRARQVRRLLSFAFFAKSKQSQP